MSSFLTMSFEMVTVRLCQADEAVEIPVNLQLLKTVYLTLEVHSRVISRRQLAARSN